MTARFFVTQSSYDCKMLLTLAEYHNNAYNLYYNKSII